MKLIFELVAQDVNVAVELAKQRDALKEINKQLKGLDAGTDEYKRLTKEATNLRVKIDETSDAQKKLNNEIKATKVPADSLAGLRLQYSKLAVEISKLSAAERNSDFGQRLIKDAAKVKGSIDGIEQSIGRFTGNVGNYESAFNKTTAIIGRLGAAFALLQGGSELVNATRETEKLFAVLKNAVGGEDKALRIFEQIKTFALETPFQLNEVIESFVKLEQRNFKPTIEQLRAIGDIASSQGKSINQFTEAILDAQTGEFERLKEFGIVAKKNGNELEVSFKGQSRTIKNTADDITNYLLELGKLPGVAGAANSVSKTLDGSLSNLSDNFTQLFASIGSSGGILKGFVDGINSIVSSVNEFISVPLSASIAKQQASFNALILTLKDANLEESARKEIIDELQKSYPEYIGNVDLAKASEADLAKVLESGNKLFEQRIFLQLKEEELTELTRKQIQLQKELTAQRIASANAVEDYTDAATGGTVSANDQINVNIDILKKQLEQLNNQKKAVVENFDATEKALFGTISANKEVVKTQNDITKSTDDLTKSELKANKERQLTAGSLEFLQDRVRKLTESLERAKPNQVPAILGDLVKAEKELKNLQDSIERLRNPETEAQVIERSDKQAAAELGAPDETKIRELTDAQKAAAVEFAEFDVSTTEDSAAMKLSIEKALSQELIGLTKEQVDAQLKIEADAEKKKEAIREAVRQSIFDSAIAFTNSIAAEEQNKVEEEKDKKIEALDEEYQAKRDAAQGNAAALAQIDKEYNKEKEEIEKEAAKERKRIAVIESIIAGALSVVRVLYNPALAIATGIAAATQTAIIARQKFAVGGFTGKGGQTDSTGERVVSAQLHEGEYVAPRSQVEQFPQLFAQLDRIRPKRGASRGIGYAVGGFTYSTAPAIPLTQSQQVQTSLNIQAQAVITPESAQLIAKYVADSSYNAIANGLNDNDRTNERKNRLKELTEA